MSDDQKDYELFISYARLDNEPISENYPHGWVTALEEQIIADHRTYETSPLRIFFDTKEIKDMDDWRNRIEGALRRSKVLLICLSPNYFKSKPCQWEWDEYQARQHHHLIGSDSHATVYFVEVPGSDEQANAKRLDAIMGKNFTDLRPWFPKGAAALREEAVRERMAQLGLSIFQRLERARRALSVPGNVRGMTPYFVGRTTELADLHRLVGVGKIGVVTAVHGLGGQGKTELAVAYARGYADCYQLGLWSLPAEGQKELLPLIGQLAFVPEFGYTPTEAEKKDATKLGQGVLLELTRRTQAAQAENTPIAPAALIILDNVSDQGLLEHTELNKLPKVDWLRLVVTTRLNPSSIDPAKKYLGSVEVDSLDPEDALRLIKEHLPDCQFKSHQDEADAREIVRELGGFTLAVEQVAVYLGLNDHVSPGAYLNLLRKDGLPRTDDLVDAASKGQIEHQTKLLGPILESMLEMLPAAGRTLLKFASLLPPERIPWPWLKELTARHHPELLSETLTNPWETLRRQVLGLRLLTGSTEDQTARMHRLISAHLREGVDSDLYIELRRFVTDRAYIVSEAQTAPADWELDGLVEAIPFLLNQRHESDLAVLGTFLTDKIVAYRNLSAAKAMLETTSRVIQSLAEADPSDAKMQRDLSVSFNKLGDVSVAAGDLTTARQYFEDRLKISRNLTQQHPTNAHMQRDLSVAYERLGDVSVAAGDLEAAKKYFEDGLDIRKEFATRDPGSAEKQRDLFVSFIKLGDVKKSAGDLEAARKHFEEALKISRTLAQQKPTNAQMQRDLSVSFIKLGELRLDSGDLTAARQDFEEGLNISRGRALLDPTNAQMQSDLSMSFERLGNVSVATEDLTAARKYYDDGLKIRRELAQKDPTNARLQRDLWASHYKIADLNTKDEKPEAAMEHWRAARAILQSMVDRGLHVTRQDREFLGRIHEMLEE